MARIFLERRTRMNTILDDPKRAAAIAQLVASVDAAGSNEDWVIPAGKDERRFCVLDVDPRCAQNHTYFAEMESELNNGGRERLLFDLQRFDLAAMNLRKIPRTKALLDQKIQSLDSV